MNKAEKYPIKKLCEIIHLARSAYYKWLKNSPSSRQQINEQLIKWIKQHYEETNGILGYRQMTITINREHGVHFNHKKLESLVGMIETAALIEESEYSQIQNDDKIDSFPSPHIFDATGKTVKDIITSLCYCQFSGLTTFDEGVKRGYDSDTL